MLQLSNETPNLNLAFLSNFMEKTLFPIPAREHLTKVTQELEKDLMPILQFYECGYDYQATNPLIDELASRSGKSSYSIWMVILILAAEKATPLYHTEQQFWDTFCDLRYKAQECYDVHGIWGTFVAHWYPIFYNGTIVKLGRMEYQIRPCPIKEPQSAFGITIHPRDPVIFLHIPSSGEPFDAAARLNSYRMAYDHFCKDGGPLVCICSSWLLYPAYESVFPSGSNISEFRKEFSMLSSKQTDSFSNDWRVFGKEHTAPPEQLPEKTSLQRAFKSYMLSGGSHGHGTGILIFDGKKVLTST